ncbi:MAG: hypothetical protein JW723_02800 [Bacteroidales bacterium]|nr:hypothetical protein [Bacteroidales bacterium]
MPPLSYSEILKKYPLPEKDAFREPVFSLLNKLNTRIVVLDDDPTGIQTVHGCLLLTNWNDENLALAFNDSVRFFYILTNTRSLNPEVAKEIIKDVVHSVIRINQRYQYRLIFISRSDSTLRGHFPLEPDTIRDTILEKNLTLTLPVFFAPALLEAGRYTIDNIQYLSDKDNLIPVAETEFADDHVFGYSSSNLLDYVAEKSENKVSKNQVGTISITDLRKSSIDELIDMIREWKNKKYVIINALDYYDLRKFALSFLKLFSFMNSFSVLRTSSSLPKALTGIQDRPLLSGKDIIRNRVSGLFIVGSHVKKTSVQLKTLLKNPKVRGLEIDVNEILTGTGMMLHKIIQKINEASDRNLTPVVYTSRKELRFKNTSDKLTAGKKISMFLVKIIKNLQYVPSYIVSKGGITSHDILTEGLKIQYARVMGQILAGVPVIITGDQNEFPNMPFIIFPGNVGDENSLKEVFEKLE